MKRRGPRFAEIHHIRTEDFHSCIPTWRGFPCIGLPGFAAYWVPSRWVTEVCVGCKLFRRRDKSGIGKVVKPQVFSDCWSIDFAGRCGCQEAGSAPQPTSCRLLTIERVSAIEKWNPWPASVSQLHWLFLCPPLVGQCQTVGIAYLPGSV